MIDLKSVVIPKRLLSRPKDSRGYPTTFVSAIVMNKPDFRILDAERWRKCVDERRCALCGQLLETFVWFVGGELTHQNHYFFDPAMHYECAEYALKVCPFLAMPKAHYQRAEPVHHGLALTTRSDVVLKKPDKFMLGKTSHYRLEIKRTAIGGTELIIVAGNWYETQWWQNGKRIE